MLVASVLPAGPASADATLKHQFAAQAVLGDPAGANSFLRPYDLDVGKTAALRGAFYCPLFADLCSLRGRKADQHSRKQQSLKVSLAKIPENPRRHIMKTCGLSTELCRSAFVVGKVMRGINGPILVAERLDVGSTGAPR